MYDRARRGNAGSDVAAAIPRASGNRYVRFAFGFFVECRTDADDQSAEGDKGSSDNDTRTTNVMAQRDVVRDGTLTLSTEFGQHA